MAAVITADQDVGEVWGFKLKITFWILKYSSLLAIIIALAFTIVTYTTRAGEWVYQKSQEEYAWALSKLPSVQTAEGMSREKIPVEKLLDRVSAENSFDPSVLRAIAMEESGGYTETNRVKEEPQLLQPTRDSSGKLRPAPIRPPQNLNQIEKLLWASSHGVLQIIFGFHYKECGLPVNGWDELHDPLTNIRCGARILKNNLDRYRASVHDQTKRLWLALRDYNNSEAYADKVMRRIAMLRKVNYGSGV